MITRIGINTSHYVIQKQLFFNLIIHSVIWIPYKIFKRIDSIVYESKIYCLYSCIVFEISIIYFLQRKPKQQTGKEMRVSSWEVYQYSLIIYFSQNAVVQIDQKTTEAIEIARGVCQSCVLSPILLNMYSDDISNR